MISLYFEILSRITKNNNGKFKILEHAFLNWLPASVF